MLELLSKITLYSLRALCCLFCAIEWMFSPMFFDAGFPHSWAEGLYIASFLLFPLGCLLLSFSIYWIWPLILMGFFLIIGY